MSQVVVKRFFGKKRGSRNMRSDKLGGASLGLFFAVFFLFGCASLPIILSNRTIPDWRANFAFDKTTCTVLDKRIDTLKEGASTRCRPEFLIAYTVAGVPHEPWTYAIARIYTSDEAVCHEIFERFEVGKQYPCWFDPQHPDTAILVRGHSWFAWLPLVLPASFLAIGGAGLVYTLLSWNKSTERRSVWAATAAKLDPLDSISDANQLFPFVPGHSNLTNSPGTVLRYRLPLAGPSWAMVGTITAAVIWNAITAVVMIVAIRKHQLDRGDWVFDLIVLVLVGLGVWLIVFAVKRFRATVEVGSTIVEIDQHPLYPGGEYKLYLSQAGRSRLKLLRVLLACDEEVTYLQGTDLRTARQRVQEIELSRVVDVELTRGEPHEARFSFEVPAAAMHSFVSGHNRILWRLLVQGEPVQGAAFERAYALNIYPNGAERFVGGLRAARSGRS